MAPLFKRKTKQGADSQSVATINAANFPVAAVVLPSIAAKLHREFYEALLPLGNAIAQRPRPTGVNRLQRAPP
jgi:hypothetical protein